MPIQSTIFQAEDLEQQRHHSGRACREFLRVPALSAGMYVLPVGGVDAQSPHSEDEIYYVIRGRARMHAGTEDYSVTAGSVIFVAAGVEHRFYGIEEELSLIVFFAPAETS